MNRLLPLLGLAALGCYNQIEIAVAVVTPDGGSPFVGPDAATQVRARVEGAAPMPAASVAPNGAFTLNLDIADFSRASRLILEALAGGEIIATGATPPVVWPGLGSSIVPVFVQRRDSVVAGPSTLALGTTRTSPRILPLTSPLVAVLGGFDQPVPIDVLDLFFLGRGRNENPLRSPFTGDVQPVLLSENRVLILKDCNATVWNLADNTFGVPGTLAPPAERCGTDPITDSALINDPNGGAYLVGGRRMGVAVTRVDRILPSGRWVTGVELSAARANPAALVLGDGELLVAGGQSDPAAPALERYAIDGRVPAARRALRTSNAEVDGRVGAALVATSRGSMAYLLGGARVGSTDPAAEDAVLDLACLDQNCPLLLRTAPLLTARRRDPVAAVADGDQVVVAGGTGTSGALESIERVDGSNPRDPVARGVVAATGGAGVSMVRVQTGSVIIVGGGQPRVMLFRH